MKSLDNQLSFFLTWKSANILWDSMNIKINKHIEKA